MPPASASKRWASPSRSASVTGACVISLLSAIRTSTGSRSSSPRRSLPDAPTMPTNLPPVTRNLLIANILVFALQYLLRDQDTLALTRWFALWPVGHDMAVDLGGGAVAGDYLRLHAWQRHAHRAQHVRVVHVRWPDRAGDGHAPFHDLLLRVPGVRGRGAAGRGVPVRARSHVSDRGCVGRGLRVARRFRDVVPARKTHADPDSHRDSRVALRDAVRCRRIDFRRHRHVVGCRAFRASRRTRRGPCPAVGVGRQAATTPTFLTLSAGPGSPG